jgi:hypothetical protein
MKMKIFFGLLLVLSGSIASATILWGYGPELMDKLMSDFGPGTDFAMFMLITFTPMLAGLVMGTFVLDRENRKF